MREPVTPIVLSARPLIDTDADADLFIGRDQELLLATEAVDVGLNTIVVGERGVGKTSFLRQLSRRLQQVDDPDRRRVVYVDGALFDNATELLTAVRERLVGPLTVREGGLLQSLNDSRLLGRVDHRLSPAGQLLQEIDLIRERLDDEDQTDGAQRRLTRVVLVDDPDPVAGHAIFGRLRDELWSLPLLWVVSIDVERQSRLLTPPADAFFEQRLTLEPFTDTQSRDLLHRRAPLDVLPDDLVYEIAAMAEGSPRQLLAIARDVVRQGKAAVGVRRQAARDFDMVLANLGRSAAMLVAEMRARGEPVSASDSDLQVRMGWTRPRMMQVFSQLVGAGLADEHYEEAAGRPGRPKKLYILRDIPGTQI